MKIENWFNATVTNIIDPLNSGRVQVRVFGYHDFDDIHLRDVDLPWATVLMPVTSANANGVGSSPTGLAVDSWVFGFFRDPDAQDPVIIGVIPGVNGAADRFVIPRDATSYSRGISAASTYNTSGYSTGAPISSPAATSSFGDTAPQVDPATNSAVVRGMIAAARKEINNTNGAKYGAPPTLWCAGFVTWSIKQTGLIPDSDLPKNPNSALAWRDWANTPTGRKYVHLVDDNTLRAGDIVVRHRAEGGHIGIVTVGCNDRRRERHTTIEGNTGSQRPRRVLERSTLAQWKYVLRWKDSETSQSAITQILSPSIFNI
jgi:hypothetical protein